MNTIAETWVTFEKLVLPKNASIIQRQEMQKAFYAGAHGMLMMTCNLGEKSISENAGVAIIESWHDECRRFALEIIQRNT